LRGDYEPLDAGENTVAFMRSFEESRLICVVPRLSYRLTRGATPWPLGEVWKNALLEVPHAGRYDDVLTGTSFDIARTVSLAEVFRDFPAALLVRRST
jgi:(1->4)-alpha-D-glucan 1-alpha-D-glucosylmutase